MPYPIPASQAYYVVAKSGARTVPLAGPYESHGLAALDVDVARLAVRHRFPRDAEAHFASYGVALVNTDRAIVPIFGEVPDVK